MDRKYEGFINVLPKIWMLSRSELSNQQKEILNDFSNSFLVKGGAGSGKTIIATHKLMECINVDGIENTYMLTYTLALRDFIKQGIIAADLDGVIDIPIDHTIDDNIVNIHNFIDKIDRLELENCIIDEVQDVTEKNLLCILEKCSNTMIFGDDGQKLYNDGVSINEICENYRDRFGHIYELNELYRNPYNILEFASKIVGFDSNLSNCKNKTKQGVLKLYRCKNQIEEREGMLRIIKEFNLKNVGILTNNNTTCQETVDFLHVNGIRCSYKVDNEVQLKYNQVNLPTVLTYHSAKGLQFENVFLLNCGKENVYCDEFTDELNYRNALYVSCTRATDRLYVFYSNEWNRFMAHQDEGESL